MAQTGGQSALELKCQFLVGYLPTDKEGRFNAPASGTYDEGTFVKKDATGLAWEQCGDNDATHILEQPVAAAGPIGSAGNREFYLQGFPQNVVANGEPITVFPAFGGRTIRTSIVATGSATGALTTSTAVGTGVEAFNGVLREVQGANTAIGETKKLMDSNGYIEVILY
jgi:hypothetical protein